ISAACSSRPIFSRLNLMPQRKKRVLIQSQESAMQKGSMLRAPLVALALILIVGVIRFAGSNPNYRDRKTAPVTAIQAPESKLTPTPASTVSLLVSPSPRVNWERLFGYAALHSIQGLDFYERKDYDRAITEYTEAIKLDPNNDFANASAYYYRGLAYGYQNEHDKAIRDFNRAILL